MPNKTLLNKLCLVQTLNGLLSVYILTPNLYACSTGAQL